MHDKALHGYISHESMFPSISTSFMFFDTSSCNGALILSFYKTGYILGNILNLYLYGILTMQLYLYYISFPEDRKLFKAVVFIVYTLETIGTAVLVNDFGRVAGNPVTIVQGTCLTACSTTVTLALCGGIVAFLTQSMYAYRIRIITQLKYLPWVIVAMIVLQLVAIVVAIVILGALLPHPSMTFAILVWTLVSVTVDVAITVVMAWFLKKDEIYSKQLKRKITHLIYLIVGTGSLTAATNVCVFILLFFSPGYAIGLSIILSKLYANSMMVLVNSRIASTRSESQLCPTLDITTIQFSSVHAPCQVADNGRWEMATDDPATAGMTHGTGLATRETGEATNSAV